MESGSTYKLQQKGHFKVLNSAAKTRTIIGRSKMASPSAV